MATDPVVAYQKEGFDMFEEMVDNIGRATVRMLYHVRAGQKVERKAEQKLTRANYADEVAARRAKRRRSARGATTWSPAAAARSTKTATAAHNFMRNGTFPRAIKNIPMKEVTNSMIQLDEYKSLLQNAKTMLNEAGESL